MHKFLHMVFLGLVTNPSTQSMQHFITFPITLVQICSFELSGKVFATDRTEKNLIDSRDMMSDRFHKSRHKAKDAIRAKGKKCKKIKFLWALVN